MANSSSFHAAITFLIRNHADMAATAISVYAVALVIVNTTKTPRDDEALNAVSKIGVALYRLLEIIVGIWTKNAKS